MPYCRGTKDSLGYSMPQLRSLNQHLYHQLSPNTQAIRLVRTSCSRRLAKAAWARSTWPSRLSRFSRRVALKIIKAGMDSKEVVARFEAERQALALMDHPNIARVLDAGTTSEGRPYFVMELVKGVPITRYCDDEHLSTRERLELCLPICQAIQHAHQKGIIHRDIKPSNVLVAQYDDEAVPKIIDFGLAKAISHRLTEKTLFTQYGQIVGTIDYMSPEQARFNQLDVDTRTDIYSMGVLLYELLTGETPFDKKRLRAAAFEELLRIIREEEPPVPSLRLSGSDTLPTIAANRHTEPKKLSHVIRGELDWIVMKALEKDRRRRYETASGLRMDLQRYLDDEPVLAGPPSASYRLRKLFRRHKLAAAAAGLVIVAMLSLTWATVTILKNQVIEDQHKRLVRQDYAHSIVLAQRAWLDSNVGRTVQILDDCPEELRGWEWHYLSRMCHTELLTLRRHTQAVQDVCFSPRGERIASGAEDGTVRIWDSATGEQLMQFDEHTGEVYGLDFSPDGNYLISAGGEMVESTKSGQLYVWDAQTGERLHKLEGHSGIVADAAFSQVGGLMASACYDNTIRVWDATSFELLFPLNGHAQSVMSVAFSEDGTRLASADGTHDYTEVGKLPGVIKLWNLETQEVIHTFTGHTEPLLCVAFSSDGTTLASGRL